MSDAASLSRLHEIRRAEERQRSTQLEFAVAELHRLKQVLEQLSKRGARARLSLVASVQSGEPIDRLAAIQEIAIVARSTKLLSATIGAGEGRVMALRQELLFKRTERRQVEALLDAARVQERIAANRRSQTALDDWHSQTRRQKRSP